MVPDFTISVGGVDRSAILKSRLTKLNLTESTGKATDELTLTFDDRDNAIVLPPHGAQLALSIGYAGQPLINRGLFTVDTTGIEGPPDIVTVRAKGNDMRATLKAHRNRSWRGQTIDQIIDQIANEHNLAAQTHPDLAGIAIAHRDQTGESDMHFVTRLAHDHDAIAAVKGGKLIFAPKGLAVSASGRALGDLALARSDLTRWEMRDADRDKHGSVRARYRDMGAAQDDFAVAGAGDPVATLRHPHASQASAGRAAHARHMHLKRQGHGVAGTIAIGRPDMFAGRAVVLSGIRDGINGRWVTDQVAHDIDWASQGYSTGFEATVDGRSADTGDGTPTYGGDDADPADTDEGAE